MANADLELDKENTQTLQQAIHLKFGSQNASESTNLHGANGHKLMIPQLKIPQLNAQPSTCEALAAQEAYRRAADARNEQLINAIKQRREQSDGHASRGLIMPFQQTAAGAAGGGLVSLMNGISGGFTIPKLRKASGEPLEEPQLNIPLLNKFNALEHNLKQLKIVADDGGDSAKAKSLQKQTEPTSLIDLTTTVIAVQKDAPPREAASKMKQKLAQAAIEHFDIPFISCDTLRNRMSTLSKNHKQRESSISDESNGADIVEKSSDVGSLLDASVGYPKPRQPQLKYAASPVEMLHLKLYKRGDYGTNIKRFSFDTPSPDDIVKEALKKSWRISRT